jgi:hypothetical protein
MSNEAGGAGVWQDTWVLAMGAINQFLLQIK